MTQQIINKLRNKVIVRKKQVTLVFLCLAIFLVFFVQYILLNNQPEDYFSNKHENLLRDYNQFIQKDKYKKELDLILQNECNARLLNSTEKCLQRMIRLDKKV